MQPDFVEEADVPLTVMPFGEVSSTYVVLGRPEGSLALGKFTCTLRFTVKEIDPSTGDQGFTDAFFRIYMYTELPVSLPS